MLFTALPTEVVTALQKGAPDAHGQPCERKISDGDGNPCRHCLRDIPAGAEMLVLAYRPFDHLHPYAECGPIFLCAAPCPRGGGTEIPQILHTSPDYLIKGYDADDRIVYGTGAVVPAKEITDHVARSFAHETVAYLHVRSARNNCYQLRVDRS